MLLKIGTILNGSRELAYCIQGKYFKMKFKKTKQNKF